MRCGIVVSVHRRRRTAGALAATLITLGAAACSSHPDDADGGTAPTNSPTAETGPEATPAGGGDDEPITVPDSTVGEQARWILDQLDADSGPAPDEARERFAEILLEQLPAEEMSTTFDQLRAVGPFEVTSYTESPSGANANLLGADEQPFTLNVNVDDDGLIQGFFLRPAVEVTDDAGWEEIHAVLTETGAEASVLAADVVDGVCEPVHQQAADQPRALGSTFKLYVLGAVGQAVIDGNLAWDDTLQVTDELKSLPSGELQDRPAGTEVTVAEAAEGMIAISDNTATDMLIDAVGREAVEQAVVDMGHSNPQLLRPLLTTREMFWLAFTESAPTDAWAAADEAERRALLDDEPTGRLDVSPAELSTIAWTSEAAWFASAEDICAAHVALQQLAEQEETSTIRDIVAVNPGVDVDTVTWPYVAFKGGSNVGVLAGSWYAEDTEGQGHVLVYLLNADDAQALADSSRAFVPAERGLELLGAE